MPVMPAALEAEAGSQHQGQPVNLGTTHCLRKKVLRWGEVELVPKIDVLSFVSPASKPVPGTIQILSMYFS